MKAITGFYVIQQGKKVQMKKKVKSGIPFKKGSFVEYIQ